MTNPHLELEPSEMDIVRRSTRDPAKAHLEKSDVKTLLQKIRQNHSDTVILKLKDHLMSDINSVVLDEIILTLYCNKVCQALYFQNLSKAMNDEQLGALTALLKKKKIWCMNLGENYNVSITGWTTFCNLLPTTSVTHLYVSEHVISMDLKNKIRANIRENRKKHTKHCSLSNIQVIERCTNMWWNPINAIRHKFAADIAREEREREEREKEEKENQMRAERESLEKEKAKRGRFKRPLDVTALTPAHSEYWAEGVGEGGDRPWKFACTCGEKCSSYEHFRYHPVGRMFECSTCSIWSHVQCVLGNICDDDLEELQDVLCSGCRSKIRRQRLNELGKAGISLGSDGIPVLLKSSPLDDEQSFERDADDEKIEVNTFSLVSTNDEEISEKMILKTENVDKYEDVICFQPRATTAALNTEKSIPINSKHVSLDFLQSLNSRKDNQNFNKNINDVGDTENSLRNALVQKISGENLLFEKEIEIHFRNENRNIIPSVQTDAETIRSHNDDAEKSSDILKNVLFINGTQGKADEKLLQDIHSGSVITNSIDDQLVKPVCDLKADQISEVSMSQSVQRSDSNSNSTEKIHLQHDSNAQNGSDDCDEHVMKCHRISSFNELHGSVTAFRSDMSRSSDNSDNCAVVSLSDNDNGGDGDGDSNNQSSDRDGESPPPSHDTPPIVLHNNRVYVAAVKPQSRPMINLAIAIDDFPPPL